MKIKNIITSEAQTWDIEVPEVHEYLLSNGCVSHNTSGLILDSTEGIEPVRQLISVKTGTYSCAQLAPQLTKLRGTYELAWDLEPEDMMNSASIRQKFVDQGQSFSLYYRGRNDSAYQVLRDIMYAETVGLKGLYYAHSPKTDEEEEVCESCAS